MMQKKKERQAVSSIYTYLHLIFMFMYGDMLVAFTILSTHELNSCIAVNFSKSHLL